MKITLSVVLCLSIMLIAACSQLVTPIESPTNAPEPSNTVLPSSTPAPTATPAPPTITATPVPPTPTITATPTPNIIYSAMVDNFNDPAFDGSFNSNIWGQIESDAGATCIVTQKNGAMLLSQTAGLKGSSCGLTSTKSANWTLTDLNRVEARLKLTAKEGDDWAGIGVWVASNDTDWYIVCHIAQVNKDQPYMNCWTPEWEEPGNPGGIGPVSLNSWHTFRMVVDPDTVTFKFYIDGYYYASYTPPEAAELKDDSFHLGIDLWNSARTSASGYVEDVYIGPKPK